MAATSTSVLLRGVSSVPSHFTAKSVEKRCFQKSPLSLLLVLLPRQTLEDSNLNQHPPPLQPPPPPAPTHTTTVATTLLRFSSHSRTTSPTICAHIAVFLLFAFHGVLMIYVSHRADFFFSFSPGRPKLMNTQCAVV